MCGRCTGACWLCCHISGIATIFVGLVWNFVRGRLFKKGKMKDAPFVESVEGF